MSRKNMVVQTRWEAFPKTVYTGADASGTKVVLMHRVAGGNKVSERARCIGKEMKQRLGTGKHSMAEVRSALSEIAKSGVCNTKKV
jgi:hypothetical protein